MKACQQTRRTIERFFFFSLNYDDADDRDQESDGVMVSLEKFAYIHTVPSKYHVSCIHPAHPLGCRTVTFITYLVHSTR